MGADEIEGTAETQAGHSGASLGASGNAYRFFVPGLAFGLRAPVAAIFIGFGFIVLVNSEDAFAPLINTIVVPLLLLSGIFLPLTLGPGWLQGIARISPFRYIIDAMREAYLGHYFNTIMVEGIAVAAGMAALFLWLGSRVFVQENA